MKRDPFGFTRLYYTADRTASTIGDLPGADGTASTIRELLGSDRTLDPVAIDAHFAGRSEPTRTCFAAVRAAPLGDQHAVPGDIAAAMRDAVERIVRTAPRPLAVALSGGLDSALVLALARAIDPSIPALVLAPSLPGYSEQDTALATVRSVGGDATVIEVSIDEFQDAVPSAIGAFETPLYNLHPVSKWLLARAAHRAGFASVISGDGADQVFTRDVSADYLPLTSAAFDAAGVALHVPFLDDVFVARVLALPSDAGKRPLRELGATLSIPPALVHGRKVSQLAPHVELDVPAEKLHALAALIGRELPPLDDDRTYVRWTTLALLVDAFEAWR